MKNYKDMSDAEKCDTIRILYCKEHLSFQEIAKKYNTYANKILRDAKRFNIPIKTKSEAQKNALVTGKTKHPTQGKSRSENEKLKIGMGVMKSWDNMDENKILSKKKKHQKLWEQKSDDEKANMLHKANLAVRNSSKVGSKLEHYILQFLIDSGIKTEFHKEQVLANTKLQIDIFLSTMNIAIEVDGPSHFQPVWGEDVLQKNISYDKKKTGLLIGKGFKLIRIKQTRDFSKSRARLICDHIIKAIDKLKNSNIKIIEIGDIDG